MKCVEQYLAMKRLYLEIVFMFPAFFILFVKRLECYWIFFVEMMRSHTKAEKIKRKFI